MDYFTTMLFTGLLIGFVNYIIRSQKKKDENIKIAGNITNYEDYYLFKKGEELYKQEKYKEAVEKFSEAIAINAKPAYYNNRGCALMYQHDNMRAIWDFSMAISMEPNEILYYEHRAMAYIGEDCYSEAFDDYKRAMILGSEFSRLKLKEYFGVSVAWMPIVSPISTEQSANQPQDKYKVCMGYEQLIRYQNEDKFLLNLN